MNLTKQDAAELIDKIVEKMNQTIGDPHYSNIESIITGIEGAIAGNDAKKSHEQWCANRKAKGWSYGEKKLRRESTI